MPLSRRHASIFSSRLFLQVQLSYADFTSSSRPDLFTLTQSTLKQTVTQRKFALLFFFLLAYLVLYPYAEHGGLRYLAFRIFGTVVTLLSVYAVSFRRSSVLFALVLGVPVLVERIALPRADTGALSALSIVLTFVFDAFIVVVLFRRVFMQDKPNAEAIFGALCIYLLVGFTFAGLYSMLETVQPRAFYLDPAFNLHVSPDRFDLIYYSFGMITCVGASGIVPVSDQARSLSVIEAILGILYLAVLISRLISAYRHPAERQ